MTPENYETISAVDPRRQGRGVCFGVEGIYPASRVWVNSRVPDSISSYYGIDWGENGWGVLRWSTLFL
ncbi:hypothetical protein [Pasteuria penetrans]|uniref:hypothetical protein n=1 Tax=Pasteuria penetrans TaxID=86005 RepID=UPI0011EFCF92|nr:hypothetical protein [Pasteuria penetrans]